MRLHKIFRGDGEKVIIRDQIQSWASIAESAAAFGRGAFCYTAVMANKTDISYGVIPIRRGEAGWEVFLIKQYSRIGNNTYWVIPKGHPEPGETPQETAVRELREETGLTPETLLSEPTFDLHYTFEFAGDQIAKTVIFFIGIITQGETVLDPTEVREAGWFSLTAAYSRLDYPDTKEVYARARDHIEKELR